MKQYIIFLDDIRTPDVSYGISSINLENTEIVVIRNSDDFKNFLISAVANNLVITQVMFDHDLGLNSLDGYECVKWMLNYLYDHSYPIPLVTSHSSNPVGRQNILSYYNNFVKYNHA